MLDDIEAAMSKLRRTQPRADVQSMDYISQPVITAPRQDVPAGPLLLQPVGNAQLPKKIAERVLSMSHDPTGAWEIVRATQSCHDVPLISAAQPKPANAIRFVCISDTHSTEMDRPGRSKTPISVPDGDVLLHCGDFSNVGKLSELEAFAQWFGCLPHKRKVIIAGSFMLRRTVCRPCARWLECLPSLTLIGRDSLTVITT